MTSTTGPELLVAAFAILAPDEQKTVLKRIQELRLSADQEDSSEGERCLQAIMEAASHARVSVEDLGVDTYRAVKRQKPDLLPLGRILRHFGTWRAAKEAHTLAGEHSVREVEARFARRRLGKIWRYTAKTLAETLDQCVNELGEVPQVAQFEDWRTRQLELAKASGDDALHLPSSGPYRRRYGSWEAALLALGHTPDAVAERLERL